MTWTSAGFQLCSQRACKLLGPPLLLPTSTPLCTSAHSCSLHCAHPPVRVPPTGRSRQRGLQPVHVRHAAPGLRLVRAPGLCVGGHGELGRGGAGALVHWDGVEAVMVRGRGLGTGVGAESWGRPAGCGGRCMCLALGPGWAAGPWSSLCRQPELQPPSLFPPQDVDYSPTGREFVAGSYDRSGEQQCMVLQGRSSASPACSCIR